MDTDTTNNSTPSTASHIFSLFVALGCIGLCLLVIFVFYIPNRPAAIDSTVIQERKETLKNLVNMQKMVVSSYMWLEKDKGVALIPVDHAMELVVEEYNNPKLKKPSKLPEASIAAPGSVAPQATKPKNSPTSTPQVPEKNLVVESQSSAAPNNH